jgi:hypothetical protein
VYLLRQRCTATNNKLYFAAKAILNFVENHPIINSVFHVTVFVQIVHFYIAPMFIY